MRLNRRQEIEARSNKGTGNRPCEKALEQNKGGKVKFVDFGYGIIIDVDGITRIEPLKRKVTENGNRKSIENLKCNLSECDILALMVNGLSQDVIVEDFDNDIIMFRGFCEIMRRMLQIKTIATYIQAWENDTGETFFSPFNKK